MGNKPHRTGLTQVSKTAHRSDTAHRSGMRHVSQEEFAAFSSGSLSGKEQETFLMHLSSCNYCSDRLAAFMSEEIIPAPRDMKENIMKAVSRPEVQIAVRSRYASKQLQLFLYSLKVGTAAIAAIALLLTLSYGKPYDSTDFPGAILQPENHESGKTSKEERIPITNTIRDTMDRISRNILDFSNQIINVEVSDYDPKEK